MDRRENTATRQAKVGLFQNITGPSTLENIHYWIGCGIAEGYFSAIRLNHTKEYFVIFVNVILAGWEYIIGGFT